MIANILGVKLKYIDAQQQQYEPEQGSGSPIVCHDNSNPIS